MLVVVKNRDIEALAQLFFDLEAARHGNIFRLIPPMVPTSTVSVPGRLARRQRKVRL